MDALILHICMCILKVNEVRVDLSDMSGEQNHCSRRAINALITVLQVPPNNACVYVFKIRSNIFSDTLI